MTMKGSQPVILNGQRVKIVVENTAKPKYFPKWLWKWMVRTVVKYQKVTIEPMKGAP